MMLLGRMIFSRLISKPRHSVLQAKLDVFEDGSCGCRIAGGLCDFMKRAPARVESWFLLILAVPYYLSVQRFGYSVWLSAGF